MQTGSLKKASEARPALYLKAQRHVSPGLSPQSKRSCVEYFPHSSVHLRVIWAQLAPRTWSGKQANYQSKPPQSERLEYEPLTDEAVDAGTWASSSWAELKGSLTAADLT